MPDLIADVLAHFAELADDLKSDADAAESYGSTGTAKAITRCRLHLTDRIADVRAEYEYLNVDQYAALAGVSPITVQRWCRNGELAGEQTAKGWRIRRTAVHQRPRA